MDIYLYFKDYINNLKYLFIFSYGGKCSFRMKYSDVPHCGIGYLFIVALLVHRILLKLQIIV